MKAPNIPVWDDHNWQALNKLENSIATDICVIGLGGSGLSCIHELLNLNQKVVGVDAGMVAGGAAGRNGGFLLAGLAIFYHDVVKEIGRDKAKAIYELTLKEIDSIAASLPDIVRQVGSLRIAISDDAYKDCIEQYSALKNDGLPVELYQGKEGRGLLFPTDAAFNPLARCRHLALAAIEKGASLYEHSPVLEIEPHVVRTAKGEIKCKQVIVAVDGRLELLLPQVKSPEVKYPVRTTRLQMLATAPTQEITVPKPVYLRWGYEYYQQLPDGRIALGGFRDAAPEEEWTTNTEPSEKIQNKLTDFLRNHIGVQAEVTHRWAASVSYKEDGLPYFGEVMPNVWAIGAYSGTGNVIGAVCGRGVAQKAVTGTSDIANLFVN